MNIEKMVEEATDAYYEQVGYLAGGAVGFGIRHVLRSLFPVVRVEELEEGQYYYCLPRRCVTELWQVVILLPHTTTYDTTKTQLFRAGTETPVDWEDGTFRGPIPSPADLGLGVGE